MRAVVVGGGLVGSTVAARLAGDGHDVVVVERDPDLVRDLSERLDVLTLRGNGATVPVLLEAGVEDADLLVAATDSDEVNMVVALLGSAVFRVPRVVARLRDRGHEAGFARLAAEGGGERLAINPDAAAVARLLALLGLPGAADVAEFLDGRLLVAGFRIRPDSDLAGLDLSHLRLLFPATPVLVVAIHRAGRWIVPHGEDEIRPGDLAYFAFDPGERENLAALLHVEAARTGRVLVAGATRIGVELARRLAEGGQRVVLLEPRRAAAEEAAAALDGVLVVAGRPTDGELLEGEGVAEARAFVAAGQDHEENVVACLLARRLGARATYAVVDNPALPALLGEVGIDAVVSPRQETIGLALRFARGGRVTAAAALLEDWVEAIEVEAAAGSRLTGGSLAELRLPRGVLVAAVEQGGRIAVPDGRFRIAPGDRALLVTTTERLRELDAVLAGSGG